MDSITYIGHASLQIELDGLRLLTDPLLTSRVGHLVRVSPAPLPTPGHALPESDAVLISHLHGDHLHLPSLRLLGYDKLLIVPRGSARFLERRRFRRVVEMGPGDVVTVRGIDIEATPANHAGRPMPGRPQTHSLGFIIHARRHVYFAGDTDLFHGMAAIGERLDVALLPVWGWGPWLGAGHLDPYRAARALEMLRPSLSIPIHWGTFFPAGLRRFLPELLHHPPRTFARHAAEMTPQVRVLVLDPGQRVDLDAVLSPDFALY